MMLVYGLTVVIAGAWLMKGTFKMGPIGIPLLIYLASHILSTLFSIDPHVSLWGYYSRFHEGLFATISYVVLYFAAVSCLNKDDVIAILKSSFTALVIICLWGILEHFGHSFSCLMFTGSFDVSCWIQDVQNRVYATLGQPNWMAAYLDVLILALFGFALQLKYGLTKDFKKLWPYILIILSVFALYCTKSRSGYLGLAAGIGAFSLLLVPINNKIKIFLCILALGFGSLVGAHWYQNLPTPGPGVTDSEAIRKPVWEGAIKMWQRYPVFGSGVETFADAFYQDRPVSKNLDSEWDFLYNKAHNEYLNLLATTGTVGILAYFLVIGTFILWMLKRVQHDKSVIPNLFRDLSLGLFAGWVTILVTNFFGFSVVIIGLYFFLIPALCYLLDIDQTPKTKPANWILIGVIGVIGLIAEIGLFNMYMADQAYALGKNYDNAQQYVVANQYLIKAVSGNPDEPTFHDELAYNQSILASAINTQILNSTTSAVASLSAEQKLSIVIPQLNMSTNDLIAQSIENSNFATNSAPLSLTYWKTKTKIYYQLATIDQKYLRDALNAITNASLVASTDAKTFYNLGLLEEANGLHEQAVQTMKKTLIMKPDYTEVKEWIKKYAK